MAYYFAVATSADNSEYVGLNIKKTNSFQKLYPFSPQKHECTLEEIDKFTTQFSGESQLKLDLDSYKIIPWSCHEGQLAIVYMNDSELRLVEGGILFDEAKKYIENPLLVKEYILSKKQENDTLFFEKLISILNLDKSLITSNLDNLVEMILTSKIGYEGFHNIVSLILQHEKTMEIDSTYARKRKPQ
ncbi:MAG: hypothetical protein IJE89_05795 [Bacilli bacterium]|nr:hypothetical protein [Bacilli bacterium]